MQLRRLSKSKLLMDIKKIIIFALVLLFSSASAETTPIILFQGSKGELSKDARAFIELSNYPYEIYSPKDKDFLEKLETYKKEYKTSQGLSSNFRHYPIIFLENKAFSGFNPEIKENILKSLE